MPSRLLVALRVGASPARAFDAFTRDIARWWQPNGLFAFTPSRTGRLAFEPGEGGLLTETYDDGAVFEVGRIRVWEPPHRLVLSWRQASFTPEQETEVRVRFEAVGHPGDETRVTAPRCMAGRTSRCDGRSGLTAGATCTTLSYMPKTEVYSWRLDPELKGALETAARADGTSVSRLLDRLAGQWLQREADSSGTLDEQRRIRARAMRYVGSIRGNDPARAGEASRRVRTILARTHARRRAD